MVDINNNGGVIHILSPEDGGLLDIINEDHETELFHHGTLKYPTSEGPEGGPTHIPGPGDF